MRRFDLGPPPPDYLNDYPPPPDDYRRDYPLPPPEYQTDYYRRDHPRPPPEYRRERLPLPPEYERERPPPPPGYGRGRPPPPPEYRRECPLPPPEYERERPPPPPDYRRERPPPPPEYGRERPPPPPEYERERPPPPPEYGRERPPLPPEYGRERSPPPPDFHDDYPPPPRDRYGGPYHEDPHPPPPWDDPRRDYTDAPPPPRGYYRQPPPPRNDFWRDYDDCRNGYDRGVHYHPREGPPSSRGGGRYPPRRFSNELASQGKDRGGLGQVPDRDRGHEEVAPGVGQGKGPKLNGTVKSEKSSTASQNGSSITPKPSQATSNQMSVQTPELKSALKKPGLQQHCLQKPSLQNPDSQKPVVQNSGLQKPGLQNPDLQQSGLQKPSLQKPGFQQSGLQKPGLQNPGLQQSGLQKPGFQQSGLQKPGLQNPGLQQSGLQKPGFQQSDLQKPGLQNPGLQHSGLRKPGLQNPSFQQSGLQKPGLQKSGFQQSGLQKSGLQNPGLQKPGLQTPGLQQSGFNTATRYFSSSLTQGQIQNNSIKVRVPGEANFISFKNSLQEYCQKKHLPVPFYRTFKNSNIGFSSRVEVSGQPFKSGSMHKDRKEAEQNAAFTALKTLGLFPPSVEFNTKPVISGVKRPNQSTSAPVPPPAKKVKVEPNMSSNVAYKSKLNEFCQKFHLPPPKYEAVRNSSQGFTATLVYNGKVYQSTAPQITRKLAEENVAQFVLSKLNQVPPPEPSLKNVIQTCMQISSGNHTIAGAVTSAAASSTNTTSSGEESIADMIQAHQPFVVSYKNELQEHCQKKKIGNPVYECVKVQGMFGCTLTVEGKKFTSSNCHTKKGSEQSAARLALQVLGPLPPAPV